MIITVGKKISELDICRMHIIRVLIAVVLTYMNIDSIYGKEIVSNGNYFFNNKIEEIQSDTLYQKKAELFSRSGKAQNLLNQGKTIESINGFNQIIIEAKKIDNMELLLKYIYNNKGLAYKNMGNLFYAKKCYEIGLKYDSITLDHSLKNSMLINLSIIEIEKRNYKKGMQLSKDLLADTTVKLIPYRKAIVQSHTAFCASKLNDTVTANKFFEALLITIKNEKPVHPFDSIIVFRNYGRYKLDQNKIGESKNYLNKALEGSLINKGKNHYQTAMCYMYLGEWYYHHNMPDSALICYNNAEHGLVERIKYSEDSSVLWLSSSYEMVFVELLQLRGRLYNKMAGIEKGEKKKKFLEKALKDYKLAIDRISFLSHSVTDESSRFLIAKKGRPVINEGVETAIALHKFTEEDKYFDNAFLWSVHAKSLSLKRQNEKENTYEDVGISEDLVLELAHLRKNIDDFLKRNDEQKNQTDSLSILIGEYEKREGQIREKFPLMKPAIDNIWSVKKIMRKLGKETYLGFFELDESFILFGLNSKERFYHKVEKDSIMINTIRDYKELLFQPVYGGYTENDGNRFIDLSGQMYNWFVQPFKKNY